VSDQSTKVVVYLKRSKIKRTLRLTAYIESYMTTMTYRFVPKM